MLREQISLIYHKNQQLNNGWIGGWMDGSTFISQLDIYIFQIIYKLMECNTCFQPINKNHGRSLSLSSS